MKKDELVSVLVPRRFLAQVYGFVAKLDEFQRAGHSAAAPGNGAEIGESASAKAISDDWSPALLRRMVDEASPGLLSILRALAGQPESWLSTSDLALAMGKARKDAKVVGGTLSAFWRRLKGRYGLTSFPFDRRTDHLKRIDCRMNTGTARLVNQFIAERNER